MPAAIFQQRQNHQDPHKVSPRWAAGKRELTTTSREHPQHGCKPDNYRGCICYWLRGLQTVQQAWPPGSADGAYGERDGPWFQPCWEGAEAAAEGAGGQEEKNVALIKLQLKEELRKEFLQEQKDKK